MLSVDAYFGKGARMALITFILLILLPVILTLVLIRKKRAKDAGIVFIVFGLLMAIIMFLFAFQYGKTPILNREIKLLHQYYSPFSNHFSSMNYKVPCGIGAVFAGAGILILFLAPRNEKIRMSSSSDAGKDEVLKK